MELRDKPSSRVRKTIVLSAKIMLASANWLNLPERSPHVAPGTNPVLAMAVNPPCAKQTCPHYGNTQNKIHESRAVIACAACDRTANQDKHPALKIPAAEGCAGAPYIVTHTSPVMRQLPEQTVRREPLVLAIPTDRRFCISTHTSSSHEYHRVGSKLHRNTTAGRTSDL